MQARSTYRVQNAVVLTVADGSTVQHLSSGYLELEVPSIFSQCTVENPRKFQLHTRKNSGNSIVIKVPGILSRKFLLYAGQERRDAGKTRQRGIAHANQAPEGYVEISIHRSAHYLYR